MENRVQIRSREVYIEPVPKTEYIVTENILGK